MEEEDAVSNTNFISCVLFIKKGVAKENPDKVKIRMHTIIFLLIIPSFRFHAFSSCTDYADQGGAGPCD